MKKMLFATLVAASALLTACHNNAPKASLKSEVDTLSYQVGMVMSPGEQVAAYLANSGSDSAFVDEFIKGFIEGMQSADNKKKLAYYMGVTQGLQSKMQMPQLEAQVFSGDSTKKISTRNFMAGYAGYINNRIALKKEGKALTKDEANAAIMAYMFGKVKREGEAFLASKAKEAGGVKLAGGTLGKESTRGPSTRHCTAADSVSVKYEGTLTDGTPFDSSKNQQNGIATFSLKNVIAGWKIAIPAMTEGSTWEFYVPADQAYGERGSGPIPPYSTLVFKITLVSIH